MKRVGFAASSDDGRTDRATGAAAAQVTGPIPAGTRLETLDVIRGIAVLGILLMNIWAFAGPQAFFDNPLAIADRPGAPVATWAVVHVLFEGSQRALFSLLFGAGMLLMVTRLGEAPGAAVARTYYRRVGWLLAFGLFDAFVLLWPADILLTYALCGLLLYPLRRLAAPALLGLAVAVVAAQAGLRILDLREARALQAEYPAALAVAADDEQAARTVRAWERILERAQPDVDSGKMRDSIRATASGSLAELYVERAKTSLILQTVVALNAWLLDALALMLLGMAALRTGLLTGGGRAAPWALLVGGYAVGLPLAAAEAQALLDSGFDPITDKRWQVLYDLRRIGVAAGHLGVILLACRSGRFSRLRQRLAAVGRMALSNYLGQSIIGGVLFYSVGLGLYGRYTGWHLYVFVLLIWAVQLVLSPWWLGRYRFGPAEWLWRSLTYGRRQALRRE